MMTYKFSGKRPRFFFMDKRVDYYEWELNKRVIKINHYKSQ